MIKVVLSSLDGVAFCYHSVRSMQEALQLAATYNDMPGVIAKVSEEPVWIKVA